MSAIVPLEPDTRPDGPRRLRAGATLVVGRRAGCSRVRALSEVGGYRARATRATDSCEVFLVNPSGGLAGGDSLTLDVSVEPDADLRLTTPTAERVYRSAGEVTRVDCQLRIGARARLDWLPQQTLLFDGARFRRRVEADVAPDGRLALLESYALGRPAHGERLTCVDVLDHWRIRRDGRLVFAEALRLEGPASELFARPALGDGAQAAGTLVYLASDAEAQLGRARRLLAGSGTAGASVCDGMLVVRWLAPDPLQLCTRLAAFLPEFLARPLPRGW